MTSIELTKRQVTMLGVIVADREAKRVEVSCGSNKQIYVAAGDRLFVVYPNGATETFVRAT